MANDNPNPKHGSVPQSSSGLLISSPAEEAKHEQIKRDQFLLELQRRQTRAQSTQAWLTAALVLLAFATAWISYWQFQAAKVSADVAASAAKIARDTLLDTQNARALSDAQHLKEFQTMNRHTAEALRTSQRQLELSERPWISAESIGIVNPLTFEPTTGGLMGIKYNLKNVGHSPGLHVIWRSKLIALLMSKNGTQEISERQSALCNPMLKMSRDLFENTIFPGDKIRGGEEIIISPTEIAAAIKSRDAGPLKHPGYISAALICCIDYQLSFATQHYQTRYAFSLGIPQPSGGYMSDFKPEGVQSDLRLIYFSQSAN